MLENAAESHTSGARFVGRAFHFAGLSRNPKTLLAFNALSTTSSDPIRFKTEINAQVKMKGKMFSTILSDKAYFVL